jgi:RNA polymerase sigma-70 factor (ECF subfamily)
VEKQQSADLLVERHNAFRAFVARHVGNDQAAAEDFLQSAYAKALERQHQIRHEESVVAWFYRLLRDSILDHYRRAAIDERRFQQEDVDVAAPEREL